MPVTVWLPTGLGLAIGNVVCIWLGINSPRDAATVTMMQWLALGAAWLVARIQGARS